MFRKGYQPSPAKPFTMPQFPLGTEPLFATKRLHDMRRMIDDIPLSPNARAVVEAGIRRIESHWENVRSDRYQADRERRDKHHYTVVEVASTTANNLKQIRDDLEDGRLSAAKAREIAREIMRYHTELTQLHEEARSIDDDLQVLAEMDVADLQDEVVGRFPQLSVGAPTLGTEVNSVIRSKSRAANPTHIPDAPDASMIRHPDS